ncbi:MAG: protein translocase subunit SecD [Anaerolineales bacterium]|nr:protein translocase subunit SecD [Anaerolineales bacterium]
MFRRYSVRLIFILILVAGAVWVVLPDNPGIRLPFWEQDIKVVQGLDLQGGLRVLLEADLPSEAEIEIDQLQTARDIIENRVNALGVTEPVVQVAGSRRILVELPGIGDPELAVATIKETGLLEFVEMTSGDAFSILPGQTLKTDFGIERPEPTELPDPTPSLDSTTEKPEQTTSTEVSPTPTGEAPTPESVSPTPTSEPVFHTVLTGAHIETAGVTQDQVGSITVSIEFTTEGAQIFADYTATHIGGHLGIVLDKRLLSAPVINSAIPDGQAQIMGQFTFEEANNLAVQLRYGALPVPLSIVENKTVGPTLGQDSLRKSTIAGLVGLSIVMAFMALYYRLPGLLADLALLCYAVLTFALFKLIPVTLTLPGIAGFVLSIGVAVDANVLIFERMKEELRAGRSLRDAIDLGFSRAWPSIRDSNLSTLITCLILYWFGNTFGASIVKGFSITLALGVLISLFTAITVTRTFLHLVLDNIRLTEHPRWFGI